MVIMFISWTWARRPFALPWWCAQLHGPLGLIPRAAFWVLGHRAPLSRWKGVLGAARAPVVFLFGLAPHRWAWSSTRVSSRQVLSLLWCLVSSWSLQEVRTNLARELSHGVHHALRQRRRRSARAPLPVCWGPGHLAGPRRSGVNNSLRATGLNHWASHRTDSPIRGRTSRTGAVVLKKSNTSDRAIISFQEVIGSELQHITRTASGVRQRSGAKTLALHYARG